MMSSPPPPVRLPPSLAAVIDRLRDEPAHPWARDVDILPLEVAYREASCVVRVCLRSPIGTSYAYVKQVIPRSDSSEHRDLARQRLIRDYHTTARFHAAFSTHLGLAAVKPLACLPDDLVIVTEEVQGETLSAVLERDAGWGNGRLDSLVPLLRRVGEWVRAFQGFETTHQTISLTGMRDYLDARLTRLVNSGTPWVGASDRRRLLSVFDSNARDVPSEDLDEVLVHADLSPANVIVSSAGITLLDFAMASYGGKYLDVSRLFTQLDFLLAKPKFRPSTVRALQHSLLAGFDSTLTPRRPLFRLFVLQHRVCHVANLALNEATPLAKIYNYYQLVRHRSWLSSVA